MVDSIPTALTAEPRWLVWRYELRDGTWTKVPYVATDPSRHAKSDNPATWRTFVDALSAYEDGKSDGIGFVLGDGWAGVDCDHCIFGPKYDYSDDARALFKQLSCYCEVSPSGTGFKAIGRSARVGGQIDFVKTPPVFTTWSGARFFTITGHAGYKADPTADITAFIDAWFPAPTEIVGSPRAGYTGATDLDDEHLLAQMLGGLDPHADKRLALWQGDTAGYPSHSEADQALVNHLAWFTNYDAARVDRLFRLSKLYRAKWERASYRRATIAKAFGQRADVVVGEISHE